MARIIQQCCYCEMGDHKNCINGAKKQRPKDLTFGGAICLCQHIDLEIAQKRVAKRLKELIKHNEIH